ALVVEQIDGAAVTEGRDGEPCDGGEGFPVIECARQGDPGLGEEAQWLITCIASRLLIPRDRTLQHNPLPSVNGRIRSPAKSRTGSPLSSFAPARLPHILCQTGWVTHHQSRILRHA